MWPHENLAASLSVHAESLPQHKYRHSGISGSGTDHNHLHQIHHRRHSVSWSHIKKVPSQFPTFPIYFCRSSLDPNPLLATIATAPSCANSTHWPLSSPPQGGNPGQCSSQFEPAQPELQTHCPTTSSQVPLPQLPTGRAGTCSKDCDHKVSVIHCVDVHCSPLNFWVNQKLPTWFFVDINSADQQNTYHRLSKAPRKWIWNR